MQPNGNRDQTQQQPSSTVNGDSSTTTTTQDDFFDQILSSTFPSSWPDLSSSAPNPPKSPWSDPNNFDDSVLLASRLRHHHLNPSPSHQPFVPLPLSLGNGDSSEGGDIYNGLNGSLQRGGPTAGVGQQPFSNPQNGTQSFGSPAVGMGQNSSGTAAASGGNPPPRQRVRARRGQATDPHSIAERLRRERIAERMKSLQELVPNANKTDKASMLDEIIDYVKFLQLQVKVLSMSRLGAAAAVAPLMADMASEGGRSNAATGSSGNDNINVTEHQVAKLMEEDMGSAMQYLQGKGLCLMPISLASAMSTATGHSRSSPTPTVGTNGNNVGALMHHQQSHPANSNNGDVPTSPNLSALTVQSSAMAAADVDPLRPAKEAPSVSKP